MAVKIHGIYWLQIGYSNLLMWDIETFISVIIDTTIDIKDKISSQLNQSTFDFITVHYSKICHLTPYILPWWQLSTFFFTHNFKWIIAQRYTRITITDYSGMTPTCVQINYAY